MLIYQPHSLTGTTTLALRKLVCIWFCWGSKAKQQVNLGWKTEKREVTSFINPRRDRTPLPKHVTIPVGESIYFLQPYLDFSLPPSGFAHTVNSHGVQIPLQHFTWKWTGSQSVPWNPLRWSMLGTNYTAGSDHWLVSAYSEAVIVFQSILRN